MYQEKRPQAWNPWTSLARPGPLGAESGRPTSSPVRAGCWAAQLCPQDCVLPFSSVPSPGSAAVPSLWPSPVSTCPLQCGSLWSCSPDAQPSPGSPRDLLPLGALGGWLGRWPASHLPLSPLPPTLIFFLLPCQGPGPGGWYPSRARLGSWHPGHKGLKTEKENQANTHLPSPSFTLCPLPSFSS